MATHSSILAWKIHGQRSLADYSPRGHKESDVTAHMHHALHIIYRIHVIRTIHIIHRAYIYTEREYIYICVYIYTLWRTLTIHLLCPKGLGGFHLMQHKIHIPYSGLRGPAQSHSVILVSSPPPLHSLCEASKLASLHSVPLFEPLFPQTLSHLLQHFFFLSNDTLCKISPEPKPSTPP